MKMDEIEELEELLNQSHGKMTITVNGMVPHIEAENLNETGSLMCCFGALHAHAEVLGADFDETVDKLKKLNSIMNYKVVGNLPGGAAAKKGKLIE